VAADISTTALDIARARVPHATFVHMDVGSPERWPELGGAFHVVTCLELLSYLERWRDVVRQCARVARYALVVLYLPESPIGFVKTHDELAEEFGRHFVVQHDIRSRTSGHLILLGRSRDVKESDAGI
jgi:ubiquinone/menaquinone biosynthesis C-methylase UbiE